jgi:UrcA family protein
MSKSLVLAGALALSALAGQALAYPLPSQTVSTTGVDFHDRAAVKALYARIYRAADTVCHMALSDRACIHETVAAAIAQADRPVLTAMYETDYGRSAKLAYATR